MENRTKQMVASLFVHEVDVAEARRFSLRGAVSEPIKEFHLTEFGIDPSGFLSRLAPTFQELPFDIYDPALRAECYVKLCGAIYAAHELDWLRFWNELADLQFVNPLAGPQFWHRLVPCEIQHALSEISPHRRRSCFQYLAQKTSSDFRWNIAELGAPAFAQAVTDVRSRPRKFASALSSVYRDPDVLRLIAMACQFITQDPSVFQNTFKITLHQMLTYANSATGSEPAPEGLHQDGSSFILSALVIERHNITGGVSSIYYTRNRDLAMRCQLQPGQGILQSDAYHAYWHSISPIYPIDPAQPAYRSILGLDIDFANPQAEAY